MEKLIITAALTGAQHGKTANPNLPEQPDEIVRQAIECWRAGAAIAHIHARDKNGRPTSDVAVFRQIYEPLKQQTDLVICLSTGGARSLLLEDRVAVVPVFKPDLASFNIGQFPMVTMGIIMGGHIRVGLEDNLYIEKGKLAQSNTQLVEKAVRIARELGREIATPNEARKILGREPV